MTSLLEENGKTKYTDTYTQQSGIRLKLEPGLEDHKPPIGGDQ